MKELFVGNADQPVRHHPDEQDDQHQGEDLVDVIILTHRSIEANVNAAIASIEALPTIAAKVVRIRLEELN